MNDIAVLIVDDEELARDYLRDFLSKSRGISIVGEARDGAEAVCALREHKVDIVFLDVQMPELSGMDVIDKIGPENMPVVVFVTAFDSYAIRAFEVNAIDYLLKPFSRERFNVALEKACNEVRRASTDEAGKSLLGAIIEYQSRINDMVSDPAKTEDHNLEIPREPFLTRLPVRNRDTVTLVSVADISWIEAADDYVFLHTEDKKHLLKDSLQNLEKRLDPDSFSRIHRSAIVNLDHIVGVKSLPGGDCQAILRDGSTLKVSRRRRKTLENSLRHML